MAPTAGDVKAGCPFRERLLIIFVVRTALNSAHRIIYPFLPAISRGLGISLQAATGLVTLRVVAGMTAPILGPLSDRTGRRRSMEFGLVLFTLASLLLATAGIPAIAAGAFALFGLAKVLYDTAMQAYIGDTVPYQERGRAIGLIELSWSCAWLLGVAASGILIERLGWQAPWAVLATLGLLGLWLTHTRLPPASRVPGDEAENTARHHGAPSVAQLAKSIIATWRHLLRRPPVTALLATSFLLSMSNEVPFIVYGAWLESTFHLGLSTLGLASIVVGLAEATAELGTTVFTDRWGKRRSVLLGLLGLAASLALLPWLSRLGLGAALVGVALMLLTFEFAIVSLVPIATELAPTARASLLSLNITAFSLGRILGAVIGGWLWQRQDIVLHALTGAFLALLAALVLVRGLSEVEQ